MTTIANTDKGVFAGVDISERHGQTVALLDLGTLSADVITVATADDVAKLLRERGATVVAIDSPLKPSKMLLRQDEHRRAYGVPSRRGMNGPLYANFRVCDFELIRRGMPLYQVPELEEQCAGWMRVGFALARSLRDAGYREPQTATDHSATLLEVFPDASFVTLLGGRPARKSGRDPAGREQRRSALAQASVTLMSEPDHDTLDALAAALTALRWRQGRGCALGNANEGMIVLPVERDVVLDKYRPLMP